MEDERDESPEYIDKAESNAAPGSETETVLSDYQDEGEQERHVEAAVCESDDTIKKIAVMQYPTDASHVDTFHIKCNDSYISMCCSVGPSQPAVPFPKNAEGRSFQKQWFLGTCGWNTLPLLIQSTVLVVGFSFLKRSIKTEQSGQLMA